MLTLPPPVASIRYGVHSSTLSSYRTAVVNTLRKVAFSQKNCLVPYTHTKDKTVYCCTACLLNKEKGKAIATQNHCLAMISTHRTPRKARIR